MSSSDLGQWGTGTAPDAVVQRWGITRAELERRAQSHHLDADGERERFCDECGNRVTEMSDGREAGHQRGERPGEEQCSQFCGTEGDA